MREVRKNKKVKIDIDSILNDTVLTKKKCTYCNFDLYMSISKKYHWCSNPECKKDNPLGLFK